MIMNLLPFETNSCKIKRKLSYSRIMLVWDSFGPMSLKLFIFSYRYVAIFSSIEKYVATNM